MHSPDEPEHFDGDFWLARLTFVQGCILVFPAVVLLLLLFSQPQPSGAVSSAAIFVGILLFPAVLGLLLWVQAALQWVAIRQLPEPSPNKSFLGSLLVLTPLAILGISSPPLFIGLVVVYVVTILIATVCLLLLDITRQAIDSLSHP